MSYYYIIYVFVAFMLKCFRDEFIIIIIIIINIYIYIYIYIFSGGGGGGIVYYNIIKFKT